MALHQLAVLEGHSCALLTVDIAARKYRAAEVLAAEKTS